MLWVPCFNGELAQIFLQLSPNTQLFQATNMNVLPDTVKFLNFRTPENFAVIYLKFKQRGHALRIFLKKMKME